MLLAATLAIGLLAVTFVTMAMYWLPQSEDAVDTTPLPGLRPAVVALRAV